MTHLGQFQSPVILLLFLYFFITFVLIEMDRNEK